MCPDMPALRHLRLLCPHYYPHICAFRHIKCCAYLLYLDTPAIALPKRLYLKNPPLRHIKTPCCPTHAAVPFVPTFSGFHLCMSSVSMWYKAHCHGVRTRSVQLAAVVKCWELQSSRCISNVYTCQIHHTGRWRDSLNQRDVRLICQSAWLGCIALVKAWESKLVAWVCSQSQLPSADTWGELLEEPKNSSASFGSIWCALKVGDFS